MATDATKVQAQDDAENTKVTFDERQQARVDELIREAQGRASRELREQLTQTNDRMKQMEAELVEAKKQASNGRTAADRQEGADDVERLRAEINEMKTVRKNFETEVERFKQQLGAKDKEVSEARTALLNERRNTAITNAASKLNFVNVGVVAKLTQDQVQWDENRNRFIVLNDQGTERMNAAYEPMSLDEFYAEYASKNPYLVRGDVKSGSGSSESRSALSRDGKYAVEQIFGPKSDSRLANRLAMENYPEYARLKAVAKENGLLP